ncbi:hypothetical protein HK405_004443 [Cladochytrium tenue]|nr:hypothetical protein HK405_004443 [Cladochytrium tenue]
MADILGAPVVLVLDCWSMARTAAAVLLGCAAFRPGLRVAGVVLNRVGGTGHARMVAEAIASGPPAVRDIQVLGAIPKSDAVVVPERHLGDSHISSLADLVESHINLDALLSIARQASCDPPRPLTAPLALPVPPAVAQGSVRIGVARDAAFCFYYNDNLALLRRLGVELVPFSPLADAALPRDLHALYIGGGYPELHAATLEANKTFRDSVRSFAADPRRAVYAECGGLVYVATSLDTGAADSGGGSTDGGACGTPHEMLALLPVAARMTARLRIGYCEATVPTAGPAAALFPPGARARGHVFHRSELVFSEQAQQQQQQSEPDRDRAVETAAVAAGAAKATEAAAYGPAFLLERHPAASGAANSAAAPASVVDGVAGRAAGGRGAVVVATYAHLHWGSNPEFARALVEAVAAARLPDLPPLGVP